MSVGDLWFLSTAGWGWSAALHCESEEYVYFLQWIGNISRMHFLPFAPWVLEQAPADPRTPFWVQSVLIECISSFSITTSKWLRLQFVRKWTEFLIAARILCFQFIFCFWSLKWNTSVKQQEPEDWGKSWTRTPVWLENGTGVHALWSSFQCGFLDLSWHFPQNFPVRSLHFYYPINS